MVLAKALFTSGIRPEGTRYGGLEVNEARRLKTLEDENACLKRLVADLTLDKMALQDALSKNW